MKLIDYAAFNDYGKEYYLNIFQIKRFCLLQFNFEINRHSGTSGLLVNIGHQSLFGFDLHIVKLSFSFDFIVWSCRDLDTYRNEEYCKK
jgi:hypothetical protein